MDVKRFPGSSTKADARRTFLDRVVTKAFPKPETLNVRKRPFRH
jgi:hypothetical protein